MKLLILGAGVIGTSYGWQLAEAGQDVTLLVRPGKKAALQDGICIHCRDERSKPPRQVDTVFRPRLVESFGPQDDYDLILVCVRSNQLEAVLPVLAQNSAKADILFFQNNWWGDQKIKEYLRPEQYFFGFSRLVGGWRSAGSVECIIFDAPGMSTMLGEAHGGLTPRLKKAAEMLQPAGLKPEISADILSWLQFHYVEYLGATGAILKAGSAKNFAARTDLVRQAILATREGLAICRARGVSMKAAPLNLKLYNLPLALLVWLGQKQYQAPNIQSFFDENIRTGLEELADQYQNVLQEGLRLGVPVPALTELKIA